MNLTSACRDADKMSFNMRFRGNSGRGKLTCKGDRIRVRVEGTSTPMGDSTWPWWAEIDTAYTNSKWVAAQEHIKAMTPARSPWDKILGIHWMPYIEGGGWLEFLNILIESEGEYTEDIVPGYASWW